MADRWGQKSSGKEIGIRRIARQIGTRPGRDVGTGSDALQGHRHPHLAGIDGILLLHGNAGDKVFQYRLVGREMLSVLAERQFPVSEVVALASTRSVGTEVSFGDHILKVKALDYFDFKGTDICLMSAGGKVAKEWAPKIVAQGAIVRLSGRE